MWDRSGSEGPARGGPGRPPRPAGGRRRGWRRSFEGRRTTANDRQQIAAWFAGRLATTTMEQSGVTVDDDEILVMTDLGAVSLPPDIDETQRATAERARIEGFREDSRAQRIAIAEEAQSTFERRVSWGARCGGAEATFTTVNAPVMTRLRMADRQVLDTLVDAGVARSRSDALAWCVRLVAQHEGVWIADLRTAFEQVEHVRAGGPEPGQPDRASAE